MSDSHSPFIRLDCPRCGAPLKQESEEVLHCEYCQARLILKRAAARQGASASQAQGAAPVASGLSLRPFTYYEPQTGLEVYTILVPQGWQVSGGVTWVTSRPAAPFQSSLQITNPNGLEAFEALPTLYFTWTNSPFSQMTQPPGSLYFGFEVYQPMAARDVMRQFVLPRYRQVPGLQIVEEGPAQELLQVVMRAQPTSIPRAQESFDSVRLRLHYMHHNQPVAEEVSGVVRYTRMPIASIFGNPEVVMWNMDYMTSFRAHREHLEDYADLYRTIVGSVKINPAWLAFVQQVVQGLTSNTICHIHQIGDLSRQISRNYDEISQMSMQGWQERSAVSDRMAENFSQSIRGVDAYYDPNAGSTVELPSGYTQAWSTPLGEYILSDDPNFNPNIGSNQNWTPLTPPQP